MALERYSINSAKYVMCLDLEHKKRSKQGFQAEMVLRSTKLFQIPQVDSKDNL